MAKNTKKDKLTVLIDGEIKGKYKDYCEKKGIIIGKQIEIFMENELRKIKKEAVIFCVILAVVLGYFTRISQTAC